MLIQAIYKRAVDHSYSLKLKAARSLLSEVIRSITVFFSSYFDV